MQFKCFFFFLIQINVFSLLFPSKPSFCYFLKKNKRSDGLWNGISSSVPYSSVSQNSWTYFGQKSSAHFPCLLHPRPPPPSWFSDWDCQIVETGTSRKWQKGRQLELGCGPIESFTTFTDLWSPLRAPGGGEDGSKMAQGWTAGRRWGAGRRHQPPLPRRAKAQGREDGGFKRPCANRRLERVETQWLLGKPRWAEVRHKRGGGLELTPCFIFETN